MSDRKDYYHKWYMEHRGSHIQKVKEWQKKNPDKNKTYCRKWQYKKTARELNGDGAISREENQVRTVQ